MLLQSVFADVQGFCDFCIVLIRIDACKNLLLPVGELIFPAQSGDNCIGAAAPGGGSAQSVSYSVKMESQGTHKEHIVIGKAAVRSRAEQGQHTEHFLLIDNGVLKGVVYVIFAVQL